MVELTARARRFARAPQRSTPTRRIAVTGADGFLGWHVRCLAFSLGLDCEPITRAGLSDSPGLTHALSDVDAVVHCAGTNRGTDDEITAGILGPASALAAAIRVTARPIRVVYANSTQAQPGSDSTYAAAKRQAAGILAAAAGFSDVVLPNLYGEHGRPHHNSVVATFSHQLAQGHEPRMVRDRELHLLHAQAAARILLDECGEAGHRLVEVDDRADRITVSTVMRLLRDFDAVYRTGELPDLDSPLRARLFNAYRSHLFPGHFPMAAPRTTDPRGMLVECVRTGWAGGQGFVSTTAPGESRGDHVHLRRFERFLVVAGEVEISLRRLGAGDVVRFRVSGTEPAFVDMPTMWAHKLVNVGAQSATTFFWSNELLRAEDPDTYPCPVDAPTPAMSQRAAAGRS